MRNSLVGVMAGLVMATAMDANAQKDEIVTYSPQLRTTVQVDKNMGTITKTPQYGPRETLSCKWGQISTQGSGTTDLLLNGVNGNSTRIALAQAECKKYGLEWLK